jgi:hypothetical protein
MFNSGVLAVNPELQRIFDSIPDEEIRSRLEPYSELILRWRRKGRSYRWICRTMNEKCGVTVAYGPLYRFVQRRSRPRKGQPEVELQPEAAQTEQPVARTKYTKLSPDEVARQRALIQDLRNKPVVVREARKRFVYDPDEPLILEKHKQES